MSHVRIDSSTRDLLEIAQEILSKPDAEGVVDIPTHGQTVSAVLQEFVKSDGIKGIARAIERWSLNTSGTLVYCGSFVVLDDDDNMIEGYSLSHGPNGRIKGLLEKALQKIVAEESENT